MKKYKEDIASRKTARHIKTFSFIDKSNVEGKAVLDIGCSYGWFEHWAVDNSAERVVGLEPDEKNFKSALQEVSAATFIEGSALDIPFPEEGFDTVVSFEVLEHIPKGTEKKMFEEAYRVLKDGGFFTYLHRIKLFGVAFLIQLGG